MFKQNEVLIAGHALWEFGAKMVAFPTFTTDVDSAVFQGLERSSVQLLHLRQAGQHMDCEIDYFGTLEERTRRRGALEAILFTAKEPVEIDIGDGYFYRAVPERMGRVACDNDVFTEVAYRFRVTKHTAELVTSILFPSVWVYCSSTVPLTDCRIYIPAALVLNRSNLFVELGDMSWTFDMQLTGDIILDGINKIFTMGGQNITNAAGFVWTDFPALKPGENAAAAVIDGVPIGDLTNQIRIRYLPTYL